jgi:hypothetical protein
LAIYLYCLLRATGDPPADLPGVDGANVRAIDLGGVAAWVSDVAGTAIVASPGRAQAHDRVVRTALERETPLPARFGQVLAGEPELRTAVSARREAFESALRRVDGTVEMTLRMLVPAPEHLETAGETAAGAQRATSGRDYLERVAAIQREERNVLARLAIVRDRVCSAVKGLVRAESLAGAAAGSSLVTVSHLVPRENIDAYRNAVQALRHEDPALAIMVSGPWAPYSFTEGIGA